MTAPTLSLTEEQTLAAVRSFLLGIMGSDGVIIEVVQGQDNRVAAPASDNYVVMTPILQAMISTNETTYHDGALDPDPGPGVRQDLMPRDLSVQLDFHGPSSNDLCTMAHGMVRTSYCCDAFAASGFDVTPLYGTDPHQSGFVNGEQQVENTWIFDLHVHCNPVVTTGQDFAGTLAIGVISVDAAYPA